METKNKKQLCKDVFSARIFIDNRSQLKEEISWVFKEEIKTLIESDFQTQIVKGSFKFGGDKIMKRILLCFSSAKVEFYLSDVAHLSERRWFVLYRKPKMKYIGVLGLAEPNWMSLSKLSRQQVDSYYLNQLRRACK